MKNEELYKLIKEFHPNNVIVKPEHLADAGKSLVKFIKAAGRILGDIMKL